MIEVNKAYKPFFENEDRYVVLYGGAGSAKSYSVIQKIIMRILSEENHRFLIVRKVARTLRVSVFQLFKDVISVLDLMGQFKINKSDMTITNLKNNSMLLFFGLDDVERLKSIAGITGIFIEEASEVAQGDFEQLNLRLRGETKYYKQIILAFNPISVTSWLKKYFFDSGVNNCFILKTTYKDNRFIDEEYKKVIESLRYSNYDLYKVYGLGEWGVLKGVIFPKITIVDEMPEGLENVGVGIDWGFVDPTVIVKGGFIGNDLYLDEILHRTGMVTREIIKYIPREEYCYADNAEPDRIEECRRDGLWVQPANKEVMAGINRVKSFNIHITKRSSNLIRDFQTYSWKQDREGNQLEIPDHFHSDGCDAVRYYVHTATQGRASPSTTYIKGI